LIGFIDEFPLNMIHILGIESSCDDTSAAITRNDAVLSNITANQDIHRNFGGVVPELASRAHQQNIIPVIEAALKTANISKKDISAVAYTKGPGLLGSLLVGVSFAKAFAFGAGIPLLEVDHLQAHILAHFINDGSVSWIPPRFPFLCLTVSGGHTQIVRVNDFFDMEIIGQTIDDAAGEAFDKSAKLMNIGYPGGPLIDQYAKEGNPLAFRFAKPVISGLDFSFSGLKTSILYFLRDKLREDKEFIEKNRNDLCASIQSAIVSILMQKLLKASEMTGIREIAIAGGVSANSYLRNELLSAPDHYNWHVFIPKAEYSTDNAAMIAITGYLKYMRNDFGDQSSTPYARSRY
jgi:N6-L-threonylcarbamoyladenine synthase